MALLTGNLKGVTVKSSRIVFNDLAISAGAAIYADDICVTPSSFSATGGTAPRIAKPFSVSVRAGLTEADLYRPGPIREGLQFILTQVISTGLSGAIGRLLPMDIGGVKYVLDRVELADEQENNPSLFGWPSSKTQSDGKITFIAHAELSTGRVVKFAVRAGLEIAADGRIVTVTDPELIWRAIKLPMITIAMVGIKLNDSTRLTRIQIEKGILAVDGIVIFSPQLPPTRTLSPSRLDDRD